MLLIKYLQVIIFSFLYHYTVGKESHYMLKLATGRNGTDFGNVTFQENPDITTFPKCAVQCHNTDCVAFRFDPDKRICESGTSSSELLNNMEEVFIKQSLCHQVPSWRPSGVYDVTTFMGSQFHTAKALCDTDTLGGGWTVLQNRFDGSQDFFKGWEEYKNGFGDPNREYWIGNEMIYLLTSTLQYKLYIEMVDTNDVEKSVTYDNIQLQPESDNYRLSLSGFYGTDITNSMTYHNNFPFSTYDLDNDAQDTGNCAVSGHGAWWYNKCFMVNLNGRMSNESDQMSWKNFYPGTNEWTSIKRSKIMIRPFDYTVV